MAKHARADMSAAPTPVRVPAKNPTGTPSERHDFASRTRFVRRPSGEKIPGLPLESEVFADNGGSFLADIMAHTATAQQNTVRPLRAPQPEPGLPSFRAAATVQITNGRITAASLITELGWAADQQLWLNENTAGYFELVTQRPSSGLVLSAHVASRGRTQLSDDARRAAGFNNGDTVLALATENNTLALIPMNSLTIRSQR